MSEVFVKTRELAEALMRSEEYLNMKAAEDVAIQNEEAAGIMAQYMEKQQELEASSGITRTQYWQYQEATAGMSKKAEKLVAIDSLNLTPEQKTALLPRTQQRDML